jgi:hypothetical protein
MALDCLTRDVPTEYFTRKNRKMSAEEEYRQDALQRIANLIPVSRGVTATVTGEVEERTNKKAQYVKAVWQVLHPTSPVLPEEVSESPRLQHNKHERIRAQFVKLMAEDEQIKFDIECEEEPFEILLDS